ncbi:hypothetical protein CS0771_40500 [Catellatospora sp. IY07-71]|uniref:hypothetical protein n=1 Tax=Catellatospora sp. IY07-71 TaxID=2728827 RepID=UPI001BB45514|nr:hypothetical protein [Catellatospora sp. IY07-71]BCJ74506.1 hypothetical protein CS0771_40500 [Catellatospora sp. IY07-71]
MSDTIRVDIVDKSPGNGGWRITGTCPDRISASGGLHVYAGRTAMVLDCASDEVIVTGRSLSGVLQNLADFTGLPVRLTDEVHGRTNTFHPATGTTLPADLREVDHV